LPTQSLARRTTVQFVGGTVLVAVLFFTLWGLFGSAVLSGRIPDPPDGAPAVVAEEGYLNRSFLKAHTTDSFDSSGGDLIVVCASSHAGVLLTPTDSFHNTWTPAAGPTNTSSGFNLRTQIWYAKNAAVGPGHTFTMQLSQPQSLVISLYVVKGADPSSPIDAISTIGDDGGSELRDITSPGIVTTRPNDLLIGFGKSSVPEKWSAGTGYRTQRRASSNFLDSQVGWALAPGPYRATFEVSSRGNWQAAVVAVRPPANAPSASRSSPAANNGQAF